MGYIAREIIEARINTLMKKRDKAIQKKEYRKAWIYGVKINKNVSTMVKFSYYKLGV